MGAVTVSAEDDLAIALHHGGTELEDKISAKTAAVEVLADKAAAFYMGKPPIVELPALPDVPVLLGARRAEGMVTREARNEDQGYDGPVQAATEARMRAEQARQYCIRKQMLRVRAQELMEHFYV